MLKEHFPLNVERVNEKRVLLNQYVLTSLRPVCLGLAPLYLLFTVSHFFLLEPPLKLILSSVALLSSFLLLSLYFLLGRFSLAPRYANAAAAGIVGIALVNSLLHLALSFEAEQSTNLALILIGAGVLLMSRFWFTVFTTITIASWLGIMFFSGNPEAWIHYAFMMIGASIVGTLAFRAHRTTYLKLATSLKQGEDLIDTLNHQNTQLEQSNQELEQFAYIASHDLQEPLRKIQAFSSRLMRKYGDGFSDDAKDSLVRIESSASRMQHLVKALLQFSRLQQKPPEFTKVDLNQLMDEVVSDLEPLTVQTKGSIRVADLPVVSGDAIQLHQLMQNLIGNGLKFAREGVSPVVSLSSTVKEDQVLIRVQDNGIGFDESYKGKIFGIFQRLHKDKFEGTGIGLAVVKKIVERHAGSISVNSTPNEGTCFTIALPLGK